jgi:hypothetical protein
MTNGWNLVLNICSLWPSPSMLVQLVGSQAYKKNPWKFVGDTLTSAMLSPLYELELGTKKQLFEGHLVTKFEESCTSFSNYLGGQIIIFVFLCKLHHQRLTTMHWHLQRAPTHHGQVFVSWLMDEKPLYGWMAWRS